MASIFKLRIQSNTFLVLGFIFCCSLYTPFENRVMGQGVPQEDTGGSAFGDGSTIVGVGLPKATAISDFISYEVAQSVAEQANKIANSLQTNSFGQNISPEAQQILLSLFTNPGFDTASALTEKLKAVGVSTELARQLSDRLEGLFAPTSRNLKKWQVSSKLSVSGQQLTTAVESLNQVIDQADPQALAKPPDELIVIQKVLAQLVIASSLAANP
jgi:hypothetical protein